MPMQPDIDDIDGIDDFDSPQARRRMRLRHVRFGRLAQEVAHAALLELKAKLDAGQPLNLTYEQAQQLRDVGVEMERRASAGSGDADAGDAPIPPTKPN